VQRRYTSSARRKGAAIRCGLKSRELGHDPGFMLKSVETLLDRSGRAVESRSAVERNEPQIFWPELHPGIYVDWRASPGEQWSRVFVTTVVHEYDHEGQQVYTIVVVALLDIHGQRQRSMGTRTVTGASIATCIRRPL
jgi:hypothetical protein